MIFDVHAVRFHFVTRDTIHFSAGKAANMLRGALGAMMHRDMPGAYASIFKPVALEAGPSGLADHPRPFVFRAVHLDGCTLQPGETFYFDVNLFDLRAVVLACFEQAFSRLILSPNRSRTELTGTSGGPISIDLAAAIPATRVRVRFLTPTELKSSDRPEFNVLFRRIRDRVSTLRALYGPGPLDIDFKTMAERAGHIQMTRCEIQHVKVSRRSANTGQIHPLGGFTGECEYQGSLGEFVPYLEAARWTGVGRQTVWGKGELCWSEL